MIYKQLGRTQLSVSAIGLGSVAFEHLDYPAIKDLVDTSVEEGVNLIDVFTANSRIRQDVGRALAKRREKFIIQGHLCTMEDDEGQNVRVRDGKLVEENFERLYRELETDYIDIGMFFYVDSDEDFEATFNGKPLEYALNLKEQGRLGHLALSSHNPRVALKAVRTGLIDVLMFSINPAYDMEAAEADIEDMFNFTGLAESGWQTEPSRQELYLACEELGIGLTVMKALAAGTLLTAETSPFGQAMTVPQCFHYVFSRPAVASILVGCQNSQELRGAAQALEASPKEKDFRHIFANQPKFSAQGRCMYCNHCQPCPEAIDVAAVTKFLHLAQARGGANETVRDHYWGLRKNASHCLACGQCEPNCPFGVDIRQNMELALAMFHQP